MLQRRYDIIARGSTWLLTDSHSAPRTFQTSAAALEAAKIEIGRHQQPSVVYRWWGGEEEIVHRTEDFRA